MKYEIRVKGHIDQSWGDWFGKMQVRQESGNVTRLRCELADQSALFGLLEKIHGLGLSLISVNPDNAHSDTVETGIV